MIPESMVNYKRGVEKPNKVLLFFFHDSGLASFETCISYQLKNKQTAQTIATHLMLLHCCSPERGGVFNFFVSSQGCLLGVWRVLRTAQRLGTWKVNTTRSCSFSLVWKRSKFIHSPHSDHVADPHMVSWCS